MITRHTTDDGEAQIRAVIEEWASLLRAKHGAGVLTHYAAGAVLFSLAPPLISTTADAKGLEAWFSTWQGRIGYEIRHLRIAAGEDTAFSHSLNGLSGTKANGEKVAIWFRHTPGFASERKPGGCWDEPKEGGTMKIGRIQESTGSSDTLSYTMYSPGPDGKEAKGVEIGYKRVK